MTQFNGDNSTRGKDSESMSPNPDLPNPPVTNMNDGADFWYYEIGVNPIPAISKNKNQKDDEGKPLPIHPFSILKYYWNGKTYNLRDDDMPRELFEYLKLNNHYEEGIAAAGGLIHRGKHQGRYLTLIDCDNQKGIEATFPKGLESLKASTLVEQHKDRLDKVHAYFVTSRPLTTIPDTARPDGIKLEVKTKSTEGLHFVSPSIHKDGQRYEIVSETKTPVWLKDEEIEKFENHLLKLAGSKGGTKFKKKDNSVKAINEEAKSKVEGSDRQGWIFSKLGTHFDKTKIHLDEIDEIDCINKAVALNSKMSEPYPESRAREIGSDFYNKYRVNDEDSKINPTQQKQIDEQYEIINDSLSTTSEIKKAKKKINEIRKNAEVEPIDWNKEDSEGDSIFKQITDVLKQKIVRTAIAEDNKSQVIVMIKQDDHVEALDLESIRFRQILQVIVSKELGWEPIDKEEYDKIISQLIAEAQIGGAAVEKTHNRIQSDEQRVVIDLGNQDFECIEITKDKIEIKTLDENSPILQRTQSTASQVKPVYDQTGSIKELSDLLNFKDTQLFSVHLVAMFLADVTTPIMALTGVAGSQKTTTSAAIKRIVDPSGDSLEANVQSIPTKRDDIIMTMFNRYLTVFENISKIDTDISDILCRAVTGSSNTKRAHYKNLEEIIMTFKRKIILNGVTPRFNNGDLQTRLIKYAKIDEEEITLLTDSQFEEKFVELRPRVFGEVCQVIQRVLGKINGYTITAKTRMAEFERWGELISQELGYPENSFGKIYEEKMKITSIENKDNYPIIGIIENLMVDKREYEGSVSELFSFIKNMAGTIGIDIKEKYVSFPKAANQLIDRMTDVGTIFDNLGIKFKAWNNTDNPKFGKNVKLVKITNLNVKESITNRYSCTVCNYNSVTVEGIETDQKYHRTQSGCATHILEANDE